MSGSENFTAPQKSNTVLWYGICGDTKIVQNKFQSVYGHTVENFAVPNEDQIKKWYNNFRHTGFIDIEDSVIHEEEESSTQLGHGRSKLSTVLHKLENWFLDGPHIRTFHPYHMELIKYGVEDMENREKFAKSQLSHLHKWSHLLKSMWFTGEARFYTDGRVESNNLVYTAHRKPDESITLPYKTTKTYHPSSAPYVTVWAAINEGIYIGPYFVEGEMNEEKYKVVREKWDFNGFFGLCKPKNHLKNSVFSPPCICKFWKNSSTNSVP